MDILIWVVIVFIYAVATITGRNSRLNLFGRYGSLGIPDFTPEFDPLESTRNLYEERLKTYYLHNKPKQYLINKNCEARLVTQSNNKMYFYCKERCLSRRAGSYFEVKGNNEHVATMWAIIDMEFNELTRFEDIRSLYYTLNQAAETRGGLRYYYEPVFGRLPEPVLNKSAQNEFCRMYIQKMADGEKVLFCSEIWGVVEYDKPRMFVVRGDKLVLYGILSEFAKEKNTMQDYLTLLYKATQHNGCVVKEINAQQRMNLESSQQLNEQNSQKEPEPIKYIHVDFSENEKTKVQEETAKSDEMILDTDPKPEIKEEELHQNIEKYNERNLDL